MQAPDLWYVPIDKKTGLAGKKVRVLGGIDSADSHHTTNAMNLDPGGATYLSDGVFHRTQIETAEGPKRNIDAGIWRFEPRTGKVDLYASYGFANPTARCGTTGAMTSSPMPRAIIPTSAPPSADDSTKANTRT